VLTPWRGKTTLKPLDDRISEIGCRDRRLIPAPSVVTIEKAYSPKTSPMPDEYHLTSYEPYQQRQDLGMIAENVEIALARLARMPTKADLVRGMVAAIFGSAALVILLEVLWRISL
jgi:hypothetical protein